MNETLQRELSRLETTYHLSGQNKLSEKSFTIISSSIVLSFLILFLAALPMLVPGIFAYGLHLDDLLFLGSFPAAMLLWIGCSAAINVDRYRVEAYYANGSVRVTGKGNQIRSASLAHWDSTSISSVKFNRAGKVTKSAVFRWEDVGFIDHSVSAYRPQEDSSFLDYEHHYRLRRRDGTRITGWTGWERLFEKMSLRFLLSQARAVYQSGQSLTFGVLGLSPEGIRYRNRLLPWEDLHSLDFDEKTGTITLEGVPQPGKTPSHHRPWASIAVGRVPNFRVLTLLVQEILAAMHP